MPIKPVTVFDTFSRTRTDLWGTGDSGHTWSNTNNSRFDVNGSVGTISVPANQSAHIAYHNGESDTTCQVLTLMRWTSSAASPLTDVGPALSRIDNSTYYTVAIQDLYDEVAIVFYQNGTRWELNRAAKTVSKNTWYWVRFERTSTALRAKVWAQGTTEPSSWTVTSGLWSGSNPPASGNPGFYAKGNADAYNVELAAYYFYSGEDDEPGVPVNDTFERGVTTGWGMSDSGHVWEGNFSLDPAIRTRAAEGFVNDPGDGYAQYSIDNTDEHYGFIGPNRSTNMEIYTEFSINSAAGSTILYIGQRGTMEVASGAVSGYGYAVKVTSGATTIPIMKKTSSGGSWTQVGTASTVTALVANTIYSVRFQLVGTTLQARIWVAGTAEPATWHSTGTDSSITVGRAFTMITQTVTTTRQVRFYRFDHTTPTPQATTTHTTTGAITTAQLNDISATLRAAFTNDSNSNNSVVVSYRVAGTQTWTTFGGTVTRTATYHQFQLTGLTPNTSYNVRVEFSDADTVVGTNPVLATITTTNQGVVTGNVTITAVGPSTIDVEATYTEDTDNNSTATLDYRVTSQTTTLGSDSFNGLTGTELSTHVADLGPAWVKHPTSASNTSLALVNNRVRMVSDATNKTVRYYQDFSSIDNQYTVSAHFVYLGAMSNTALIGRASKTLLTYYGLSYSASAGRWELYKQVSGVYTLLGSFAAVVNIDDIHVVELVLRDDYKAAIIDGVERIRSTDNTIASGVPGLALSSIVGAAELPTETNHVLVDNYTVTTRSMGGSWTSAGAMTADRVNKKFTKQLTGLTADTVYEVRVTYADTFGVRGFNPISATAMTTGAASGLFAITSTVQPTSVVLDVFYYFDSNANSSLAIEYRSVMDFLWTTVPSGNIQVDRGAKKFTTILSSLSPNTTYQVRATITDPDGFIQGLPSQLTGLITTSGAVDRESPQIKHFLWKIYDADGNYLETWHDAGTPEFSWHENGGVTDLRVTLPRPLSTLNDPYSSIQFQHRVDIWVVDPSSNGFGTNYMVDGEFDAGGWTIDPATTLSSGVLTVGTQVVPEGPDGSNCMKIKSANTTVYTTRSTPIPLFSEESLVPDPINVPFIVTAIGRAVGSKLKMFVEAYDKNDQKIDQSAETAETVGPEWQKLRVEYVPKQGTYYLRVTLQNDAVGTMWVDKVVMLAKEQLIYRGFIERFKPEVTQNEQNVEIEILGPVSLLSDDYIEFLQFIDIQPQKDIDAQRPHFEPSDPADMMREVIRVAKRQNPRFMLYYTADSIRNTGTLAKYTFRDQQIRACMDKIRSLCPSGWHYYIEADGLVVLRGPEHATTHTLRLGVETMNFSVDKSIRNLKNYIHVKGRQDEDRNEPDGHGSIHYITFDQESINKYGKRMMFIRDAQITDPDTAELVGDGRLEEMNREEQRAQCLVLDEKQVFDTNHALRGYNIEAFRPGDMIRILDPVSGPLTTYWDQFTWDKDTWDTRTAAFTLVSDAVPIKTVQYEDTQARLELSERQPSSVGDFGRLYRWLQLKEADSGE
jgi:hypothetical protein